MKKQKKTIWVMCGYNESGDHFHCCESWDHNPTEEEIDRVRVEMESTECDDEDDANVELDDKLYITDILTWKISQITV